MAYLDVTEFKNRSTLPATRVDALESSQSGWISAQLETWSRWIDSRLAKRYTVPFASPPEQVRGWLARIVTLRIHLKNGVDPSDEQFQVIRDDAEDAKAEIAEAANGENGLYELPTSDSDPTVSISRDGPLSFSETSPYVGLDEQAVTGRSEDRNGGGSFG